MPTVDELYNTAQKLRDEGREEEALAQLQDVLARDESHVLTHLALAVLYGKLGQPEDAVRHGERACELEPDDPFNFTALSVTYQRAWQGTQNPRYIHLAEEAMARAHMLQGRR